MHPTSNTERQSSIVDSGGGDRQIQSASPIKEPTVSMNLANRAHTPPSACQTSPVGPVPNRTNPNRIERPEHETRRHSFPEHRYAEPRSELPNQPQIFPHADKTSAKLTHIEPPESHDLPQNAASPHFWTPKRKKLFQPLRPTAKPHPPAPSRTEQGRTGSNTPTTKTAGIFLEHRHAELRSELPGQPKIFPHADKTSTKLTQIAPPCSHDLQ